MIFSIKPSFEKHAAYQMVSRLLPTLFILVILIAFISARQNHSSQQTTSKPNRTNELSSDYDYAYYDYYDYAVSSGYENEIKTSLLLLCYFFV